MGLIDGIMAKDGYYLYREYFPWGRCDGFRNEENDLRFFMDGGIFNSQEDLYNYLKENWTPQAEADVRWKMQNIK